MSDEQQPIRSLIKDNDERSFYEILGVNVKATDAELKRAYYRLAKEVHPDKNNSDEAKDQFQKLGRIYNILKDPQTRKFYDENGDIEQTEMDLSGEEIYELWLKQYNIVRLTEEKISQYFQSIEDEKKKYGLSVGAEEERDLLDFYHKKNGDMKLIKEYVFNCETKKDVVRMCDHLNKMIKDGKLTSYPMFYKTATLSPDDNITTKTSNTTTTTSKKKNQKKKPVEEDEEEEEEYDDLDMIDDDEEEEEEVDSDEEEEDKPRGKKSNSITKKKVPITKKPVKKSTTPKKNGTHNSSGRNKNTTPRKKNNSKTK